ncbi:hypothetical protein AMS68_003377 [Peltaster fructicola]|uniref:Uncharacterized protein n=1 Tax=Peltaster fructicola TaxID=286661 RepID=A0A6H0XTS7_9PEZI|nr:hypothetical protein AMS68_003377 [Peltaster fructicola]
MARPQLIDPVSRDHADSADALEQPRLTEEELQDTLAKVVEHWKKVIANAHCMRPNMLEHPQGAALSLEQHHTQTPGFGSDTYSLPLAEFIEKYDLKFHPSHYSPDKWWNQAKSAQEDESEAEPPKDDPSEQAVVEEGEPDEHTWESGSIEEDASEKRDTVTTIAHDLAIRNLFTTIRGQAQRDTATETDDPTRSTTT